MTTGGKLLIEGLEAQGVDRVFCIPGESYLAALDAFADSPIDLVLARQEGGAAMMAEADGKQTGRPGVCFVTRGPGATNASSGVHVAQQDSTPMVIFIGQVAREMRGRDAFQEIDYVQFFGSICKHVEEINDAAKMPEVIGRAFRIALAGRPGPVAISLPEDMLTDEVTPHPAPAPRAEPVEPNPDPEAIRQMGEILSKAKQPVVLLGGSRWTEESYAQMATFAERWGLPVSGVFRRHMLFDHTHPNYAGDLGIGPNPALKKRIDEADVLLMLGTRLGEMPSQGYTLLDIPNPKQTIIHVHSGAEELGHLYTPDLAIHATPGAFLGAALSLNAPGGDKGAAEAHASYLAWSETPRPMPGAATWGDCITHLRDVLPPEAILTTGAGNYAGWFHRFFRVQGFRRYVGATCGSMGYSLPAAIAAKLRSPDDPVICLSGDGCFQMTSQEFGTAAQVGANVVVIISDNGLYGTIRMHQERDFPGRTPGTAIENPDFAAIARAYGCFGAQVLTQDQFAPALAEAMASDGPSIIHVKVDPEAITPVTTVSEMRERAAGA